MDSERKRGEKSACSCGCGCEASPPLRTPVPSPASGCWARAANCRALLESTQEAVRTLGLPVEAEYVTDMKEIMASGAMAMPALEINGKLASAGRVLKAGQVARLLAEWGR